MKSGLTFLLILVTVRSSFATPADTTIHGIRTEFEVNTSMAFPSDWLQDPIHVSCVPIDPHEILRCQEITERALLKYPAEVLSENLKAIYFFKSMRFYDVSFGGTNSSDALYLTNNGARKGYTDLYLEQTFHHELSSIFLRNYSFLLDTVLWMKLNEPGFNYNDPENGVGAIRNRQTSPKLDTFLCARGFLTQYACSSLENDFNTLAQNLFVPAAGFWETVDRFPAIREKVKLLVAFYNNINSRFTENYFRQFAR
jgi:hypothetical protein